MYYYIFKSSLKRKRAPHGALHYRQTCELKSFHPNFFSKNKYEKANCNEGNWYELHKNSKNQEFIEI